MMEQSALALVFKSPQESSSFMFFRICMALCIPTMIGSASMAQTVMLPTIGVFSVNTSVAVPDQGTTYAGGNTRWQNFQRGRSVIQPSLVGNAGVSKSGIATSVTVIDLEELEKAILASAEQKPQSGVVRGAAPPDMLMTPINPNAQRDMQEAARRIMDSTPKPYSPPDYAYVAILSHPNNSELSRELLGDVEFYLEQARVARRISSWEGAQVMYEKAWERLPPYMKQEVIAKLAERKAIRDPNAKKPAKY
jgi:hypothetical protein